MFAKVIVDVPAKQTDRPFDYQIPECWRDWIHIGSRVGVPFGPRVLQGFVVGLSASTTMEISRIRSISSVMDAIPPLTEDLVELSEWMSQFYLCSRIAALLVMLPGALKAKYERYISVPDVLAAEQQSLMLHGLSHEIIAYTASKKRIKLETLLDKFNNSAQEVKELLSAGLLHEEQTVGDRMAVKTGRFIRRTLPLVEHNQAIAALGAGAKRQKDVMKEMACRDQSILLTELTELTRASSSAVKALIDKGWLAEDEVVLFRDPYKDRIFTPTTPMMLTEEQNDVYKQVQGALDAGRHEVFLLHGVTGSGKTEIYLQAIARCLLLGKEAIVLVPEISLTPQMVERFKGRFGDKVAVLHSRLSHGERYDEWRKTIYKQVQVVIGARSAIFAPFQQLGLIIIDEEHETSYKQEESPRYHAREVAMHRAEQHQGIVMLGSATPSLECYYDAVQSRKEVKLVTMKNRVQNRPMPIVHVIDMREELQQGNRSMFSKPLHDAIKDRLIKQEQIVLLLNRRGHSTFIMCRSCGYVASCPHCDISLTFHSHNQAMRCHYCGHTDRVPSQCPACESEHIRYFGTGTQRVEEELLKLFPSIRIIRMDVDTTGEKGSHEKLLSRFGKQQADVLLGTQMVAKGLDFPLVTLVGVISADTVLHLPDFRAAEKTFQLITQVAGRAGRHQLLGEVVVQTYAPEHYSIYNASNHHYESFFERELQERQAMLYPPFSRLILITMQHESVPLLVKSGQAFVVRLKECWMRELQNDSAHEDNFMNILGPVASPIPRIKDRYRYQCVVKYRGRINVSVLVKEAAMLLDATTGKSKLIIQMDVDPQMLM